MSNQINTLYCGCIANPWLDIVDKMKLELNLNPKYFIGWDDGSIKVKDKYPSCFYQTIEDAWKGVGFPNLDYTYALDEKLLKKISFEEIQSLKMMDRLDLDRNSFSLSQRQSFFYHLLKTWLVILDKYDIGLVVSPSVPHRVFDYVLYIACKITNIEFIMFQMTPFSDSSFIINDVNQTTDYFKHHMKNNLEDELNLRTDIKSRIDQVFGEYKDAIPHYMKEQSRSLKNNSIQRTKNNLIKVLKKPNKIFQQHQGYHVKAGCSPMESQMMKLDFLKLKYKNKKYLRQLEKKYFSFCSEINLKNTKYVFVALHYQPEETSNPTGGTFVNQRLIIELLNSYLEQDILILVKEHKTQFHPDYEGATGRSKNFYKEVLTISKRIKFVDVNMEPFDLIDNAIAVATISGTIGWESAIRGTPTLIFGRAWYEDMMGIFKIKSLDDLKKKWDDILKIKNNIQIKNIYEYHKKLQYFLINAPHYKAFVNKNSRSKQDNVKNIFNGIKSHLTRVRLKY